MNKSEILTIVDKIESLVVEEIGVDVFDREFHKIIKVLSNRYIQPELEFRK